VFFVGGTVEPSSFRCSSFVFRGLIVSLFSSVSLEALLDGARPQDDNNVRRLREVTTVFC